MGKSFFDSSFGKKLPLLFAALLVVVAVGAGAFYVGYERGTENPKEIVVTGLTNIDDEDVTADFGLFWEAWDTLKSQHLQGGDIEDQAFIYGAIHGLTATFGDPNTIFLPPDDSKKFGEDISGNFGGIGAEIGLSDQQLIIVAPLKDSPADEAGVQGGDLILKIDGEITVGITLSDAVKKIRGPIGEPVILTMFRDGWDVSRDIEIVRDQIIVPTADWEIVDNIIHLRLFSFNQNAPLAFADAAINGIVAGVDGMVLDLRNNPGGFLEVAINLAGWFVDKGEVVVSEQFRSDDDRIFRANGNEALKNMPVVILINQGSASASEILAGALRDLKGITLIGAQSFGKGTVQELHSLRGGSQLKITTAHWVLPNGQIIEKNGLTPDIEIPFTDEDFEAGRDPQLEGALEFLKSQ